MSKAVQFEFCEMEKQYLSYGNNRHMDTTSGREKQRLTPWLLRRGCNVLGQPNTYLLSTCYKNPVAKDLKSSQHNELTI